MDRARAKTDRTSPDEITEHWRALVGGRWSLLDEFDSDGRRFIVARRNDLAASDPNLSERERQVAAYLAAGLSNKEIAYQLGLSVSTVGTHARRIARKLGATGRVTLVEGCARYLSESAEDASP
jgi:DNA-binding NarL/FixJ family response regulator